MCENSEHIFCKGEASCSGAQGDLRTRGCKKGCGVCVWRCWKGAFKKVGDSLDKENFL